MAKQNWTTAFTSVLVHEGGWSFPYSGHCMLNCVINGKTLSYELIQARSRDPYAGSKSAYAYSFPVPPNVRSFIVGLFNDARPSAIVDAVSKFIIYPVYSESLRSHSHVFKKISKILPSITHGYSTITIEVVFRISRVFASILHCLPRSVCGGSRHSMRTVNLDCLLYPDTSTATSVTRCKPVTRYNNMIPAFTDAIPLYPLPFRRRSNRGIPINNEQLTVTKTGSINKLSHGDPL